MNLSKWKTLGIGAVLLAAQTGPLPQARADAGIDLTSAPVVLLGLGIFGATKLLIAGTSWVVCDHPRGCAYRREIAYTPEIQAAVAYLQEDPGLREGALLSPLLQQAIAQEKASLLAEGIDSERLSDQELLESLIRRAVREGLPAEAQD